MQKLKMSYNYCQHDSHTDECLNTICIEKDCEKNRLLCCLCLEEHEGHKIRALKKFLVEYRQQYQKLKNEEEEEYQQNNLLKTLKSLEIEVQNFKQIIEGKIKNLLQLIQEQIALSTSLKLNNKFLKTGQTLENIFFSEQQNIDLAELLKEVENFQPYDGFSFQIRKPETRLVNQTLRFQKSQQILNDYIQFNQKLSQQIESYFENINYQLQNQFSPDSLEQNKNQNKDVQINPQDNQTQNNNNNNSEQKNKNKSINGKEKQQDIF